MDWLLVLFPNPPLHRHWAMVLGGGGDTNLEMNCVTEMEFTEAESNMNDLVGSEQHEEIWVIQNEFVNTPGDVRKTSKILMNAFIGSLALLKEVDEASRNELGTRFKPAQIWRFDGVARLSEGVDDGGEPVPVIHQCGSLSTDTKVDQFCHAGNLS
ncbi:hypothetical protein Tco_0717389 [Tanacetum coccineum]